MSKVWNVVSIGSEKKLLLWNTHKQADIQKRQRWGSVSLVRLRYPVEFQDVGRILNMEKYTLFG